MNQYPDERQPTRERIEHHEVVERAGPADREPRRPGTPLWLWLLPLVLVVIALAWFVFTQGQPRSPVEGRTGVRAPEVNITTPSVPAVEAPRIEAPRIEAPAADPSPAPGRAEADPAPEAAPADPD
jgi:hypothetical protein